jgi:Gram-negative bacterial TonB protein C-terminal
MSGKFLATLAMIATASPSFAQSSKGPLVLKPFSAWHVDYADDRCRLARQFGEGEQKVFAFFDRYGPDDFFKLTLAGKPVSTWAEKAEAAVQFGPAEAEQMLYFLKGTVADNMPALIFTSRVRIAPASAAEQLAIKARDDDEWIELTPVSLEREAAIRYLSVGKPLRRPVILETGSMRAPIAALNKCIDNLVTYWGVDVEKHKNLTARVKPLVNPGKWSIDYPVKMLRVGQPAIVEFRLSVDTDGKPTTCHIQSTTRPKEFDAAVCGWIMKRARFSPALDAEGKPLASYYRNTVRFALP